MARTLLTGERATIGAADVQHYLRVEVTDADGVFRDLTNWSGDWVLGADWGEDRESSVSSANIQLRRASGTGGTTSLAPLVQASTLNRNSVAAYAPLLDIGRRVRISTAVRANRLAPVAADVALSGTVTCTAGVATFTVSQAATLKALYYIQVGATIYQVLTFNGTTGATLSGAPTFGASAATLKSDYREVWLGRINRVGWSQDPVVLNCTDEGGWLMDTQIETLRSYSNTTGIAVETVMQSILTDNPNGGTTPTLYTPVSPSWNILQYTQDRTKVLEALRALASQIGYDMRFRYDAAHVFRLTFSDPLRSRVTVDDTIGPTEYTDVEALELNLDEVRNVGVAPYRDASGVRQVVTQSDAGSISKHRRRYFELNESLNIRDATNAQKLIDAAVVDVSTPGIEQSIRMLYYWPVQIYDRYTFTQNGDHYDTDQTLAVGAYRHVARNGFIETTIGANGKVAGAYYAYAKQFVVPVGVVPSIVDINVTFPNDTHTETLGTGDKNTASWKVVVRTDRLPTLSEVRAATPVDGQTCDIVHSVATPVGSPAYVGALVYSAGSGLGNESNLVFTQIITRQGSGLASEPTPQLTAVSSDTSRLLAIVTLDVIPGNTAKSGLTYALTRKLGAAAPTTIDSGTCTALPKTIPVARSLYHAAVVTLVITDALTGIFSTALTIGNDGTDGAHGAGTATGRTNEDDARSSQGGIPTPDGRIFTDTIYDATGSTPLLDATTRQLTSNLGSFDGLGAPESQLAVKRRAARSAGHATGLVGDDNTRSGTGGVPTPGQRYIGEPVYDQSGATLLIDPVTKQITTALAYPSGVTVDSLKPAEVGATKVLGLASNQITPTSSVGRSRCKVYHAAGVQTVLDVTDFRLVFDSEVYDVGSLHSTVTNPGRITIPTGGNIGVWQFVATVSWDGVTTGAAGTVSIRIKKNNSTYLNVERRQAITPTAAGYGDFQSVVAFDDAPTVGDYYEVEVHQTSGATRTIQSGGSTLFTATHLW